MIAQRILPGLAPLLRDRCASLPDGLMVDLFAGGGGASLAIERVYGRSPDIAINHDANAPIIATNRAVITANHQGT